MFDFIEDEGLKVKVKEAVDTLIQTSVKEQVEAAVVGLKSKNDELLSEKKKIQEKFILQCILSIKTKIVLI
jgi:hypothetical protein